MTVEFYSSQVDETKPSSDPDVIPVRSLFLCLSYCSHGVIRDLHRRRSSRHPRRPLPLLRHRIPRRRLLQGSEPASVFAMQYAEFEFSLFSYRKKRSSSASGSQGGHKVSKSAENLKPRGGQPSGGGGGSSAAAVSPGIKQSRSTADLDPKTSAEVVALFGKGRTVCHSISLVERFLYFRRSLSDRSDPFISLCFLSFVL